MCGVQGLQPLTGVVVTSARFMQSVWYALFMNVPSDYTLYIAPMRGGQSKDLACKRHEGSGCLQRLIQLLCTRMQRVTGLIYRIALRKVCMHVVHGRTYYTLLVGIVIAYCMCTTLPSETRCRGTVAVEEPVIASVLRFTLQKHGEEKFTKDDAS